MARRRTNAITRARAFEALHEMRTRGMSLREAARYSHTTPKTVQKYLPAALKRVGGRFAATKSDRYARSLKVLTEKGRVVVSVRGSRLASDIARYSAALRRVVYSGDASMLAEFHGRSFKVGNTIYPFITDLKLIKQLGRAHELEFEELYADVV